MFDRNLTVMGRPRVYGVIPVLLLMGVMRIFPPDGQERFRWMQTAGHFHLLIIHFPIALLYLVPLLELLGRHHRLPHLKASVEFVLLLAMLASLFAVMLGWVLARSGGYSGRIVTQHMWGGIFVAAACWLCWVLRVYAHQWRGILLYSVALAATIGLVSWTGYRGGQLTQGESHLNDDLPALVPLAPATTTTHAKDSRAPVQQQHAKTLYRTQIRPIFAANCYSCHGAEKQRGQLRLDSYAAIMRGGKHGKVIIPGDLKQSELIRRIHLPQSEEDAMPPEGRRPLTADETKVIEFWVKNGASELQPVVGIRSIYPNESQNRWNLQRYSKMSTSR